MTLGLKRFRMRARVKPSVSQFALCVALLSDLHKKILMIALTVISSDSSVPKYHDIDADAYFDCWPYFQTQLVPAFIPICVHSLNFNLIRDHQTAPYPRQHVQTGLSVDPLIRSQHVSFFNKFLLF